MRQLYHCLPSFEEERPEIDFENPENAANDWLTIGKAWTGLLSRDEWPSDVVINVDHPDATMWDGYSVGGAGGAYSLRFMEAVRGGLDDFALLPASLNGERYYFLKCERRINCFDRQSARFETYPGSSKIMAISHFAFNDHVPIGPTLFGIPETLRLLATEPMVRRMRSRNLKGVLTEPLP